MIRSHLGVTRCCVVCRLSSDLGPERRNRGGGVQGGSPGPAESTDADSIPPPGVQAGQRFGDSVQSVGSSRFGDA
eukprot:48071-Rhodomonas_salina.1